MWSTTNLWYPLLPRLHQNDHRLVVHEFNLHLWYYRNISMSFVSNMPAQSNHWYAALICSHFIQTLPISDITSANQEQYHQVLPSSFVATKADLANDMFKVKRLEDEFCFKYTSVIGMLIFSMNTFVYLYFTIRKLAKFMIRPGASITLLLPIYSATFDVKSTPWWHHHL